MDIDLLQGEWKAVRIEQDGISDPADIAEILWYIFDGERVTVRLGDMISAEGVIHLDPTVDPKTFDFTPAKGLGKRTVVLGIYRVERETLTVCFGKIRPTQFDGEDKTTLVELFRFVRSRYYPSLR